MVSPCPDSPRRLRQPRFTGWLTRRLNAGGGSERGQALIVTALAMTVLLIMCAASIDLSTWYQKHHQAQLAADSAALAAANCLSRSSTTPTNTTATNCTSTTDTTDAQSVAAAISGTNLPGENTPQVTINTTAQTVTVTASANPAVDFAGIVSVHPSVSARSVASFNTQGPDYSIFVGNDSCTTGSGLQIASGGGGNANANGVFSDGVVNNNDNSNATTYSGGISDGLASGGYNTGVTPYCGSGSASQPVAGAGGNNNSWNPTNNNTTLESSQELAYPEQYTEPVIGASTITTTEPSSAPVIVPGTCTFASTYFSTDASGIHQINYPGIYCVTNAAGTAISTSYSGTCGTANGNQTVGDDTAGSLYVGSTLEGSGGFEFVGPCVIGDSNLSSSAAVINSATPLIYGTEQNGTGSCLNPATMFVNPGSVANPAPANPSFPDNVYLTNNNLTLNGAIYAPCGTVELAKNNDYAAFVEAANVTIDKNNFKSFVGTGPAMYPAQDGLSN
jgi:Flp pilus assembly protein TadG